MRHYFADGTLVPSASAGTVLSYGEVLWDLLPGGEVLGGAPANLAFRLASQGIPSKIVSRVGRDPFGDRARRALRTLGLDDALVQSDAIHPTGTVRVTFDASGAHEFDIIRDVAYDFIVPAHDALEAAATAAAVCFGSLIQRAPRSRETLTQLLDVAPASWIVCDVNLRCGCYSRESLLWSTTRANVLKLNDDEVDDLARLLAGSPRDPASFAQAAVESWDLRACVVTLGARGALAADDRGTLVYEPGFRVDVRDTIGSGDAFTAAFLSSLMSGESLRHAVQRGNALGALVATQEGATNTVERDSVARLMSTAAPRIVDEMLARLTAVP